MRIGHSSNRAAVSKHGKSGRTGSSQYDREMCNVNLSMFSPMLAKSRKLKGDRRPFEGHPLPGLLPTKAWECSDVTSSFAWTVAEESSTLGSETMWNMEFTS